MPIIRRIFYCGQGKYIVFTFLVLWRCFKIAIKEKELPINTQIRAENMLVIGPNGEQLGSKSKVEALTLASYAGFDLVQISETKDGVVCKLMDYNKFRYEKKKKQKEAQKKQKESNAEMKEYRLSVNIDKHDIETKQRNIRSYLLKGHKIKVTVRFKGREMENIPRGKKVILDFVEPLSDISDIESDPKLDGRNMMLLLAPKK